METNKNNNSDSAEDRIAEIADALAEGREVDWANLTESAGLTPEQVKGLRALHLIHQIQIGDVPLDGEAPEVGVAPTRFEVLAALFQRERDTMSIAHDRLFQKTVILRELKHPGGSREAWNSYVKNARKLAYFTHEGIARVLDVDESIGAARAPGLRFVMETPFDGAQVPPPAGKLTTAELVRLALDVSGGLAALEARGFLHHSVSPKSIFKNTQTGSWMLADFADPEPATVLRAPAVAQWGNCLFTICAGRPPHDEHESLAALSGGLPAGFIQLVDGARGIDTRNGAARFERCAGWHDAMRVYLTTAEGRAWSADSSGVFGSLAAPFRALGRFFTKK